MSHMDKEKQVCYHVTMILTLSVISCVKGANMVSSRRCFCGVFPLPCRFKDTAIFLWEERYGNTGSSHEHHCGEQ